MFSSLVCYCLVIFISLSGDTAASDLIWTPVFVAYQGNGHSVYDAWKNPSTDHELAPLIPVNGKRRHLRSHVVNLWTSMNIKMVKIELMDNNSRVGWMTFNAVGSDYMNWFSKDRLYQSSFPSLSQCSTTNFFSMEGHVTDTLTRRFLINKSYNSCPGDLGWFMVLDKTDVCQWSTFDKYPVFLYTDGGDKYNTDSRTADTMIFSIGFNA